MRKGLRLHTSQFQVCTAARRCLDTQAGVASSTDRRNLRAILTPIVDRLSTQALSNSTLVTDTATAKIGAADSYFSVKGKLVKIAASTTMGAIAGNISASKINVYCFFVDQAGTLTNAMGTEATALLDVVFPPFPEGKCLIGYAQVTCSGGGGFRGRSAENSWW